MLVIGTFTSYLFRKRLLEQTFPLIVKVKNEDDKDKAQIDFKDTTKTCSCRDCVFCCYVAILKYNLYQEAYSVLATVYQYILTLPITQVTCERSFSILKYIKNRLRNRLGDERLESFMLMNIERSLLNQINNEDIINEVTVFSTLLKKSLMY